MRKLLMTLFIVVLYTACKPPHGEPVPNLESQYSCWTFEQVMNKTCGIRPYVHIVISKDNEAITVATMPRYMGKYKPGDIIGEVKSEDVTETFEEIVNE